MRQKKFLLILCPLLITATLFALLSFGSAKRVVHLRFIPCFGENPLQLNAPYPNGNRDTVSIKTFKFYLSHITLLFESGYTYHDRVEHHLLDAENPASLDIVLPEVLLDHITAIRYTIGVDSMANVLGALEGDLDPAKGMYWAWNSGYIHAKLEGTSTQSTAHQQQFEFHIGGYLSPYSAARQIILPVNSQIANNRLEIKADAQTWLQHIDLARVNSVVIPGAQAMQVADDYMNMFSVSK